MKAERPFPYGGQAVLEGIMIRGRTVMSVAVRRPSGDIASLCEPLGALHRSRALRIPLLRGLLVLWETLSLGVKALRYSASVALGSEEAPLPQGATWGILGLGLLVGIGLFFVLPLLLVRPLEASEGSLLLANAAEGVVRLLILLAYLWALGRMPEIQRLFAYHGAEHMTIHAYEAGVALEPSQVGRFSTAHPRCGTAFLLLVVVLAAVLFVFVELPGFWERLASRLVLVPLLAAASYEVLRLGARFGYLPWVRALLEPTIWLQALTTRQPQSDQIEVAIVALRQALEADGALQGPAAPPLSGVGA